MTETEARVRLAIYEWFLATGAAPTPADVAAAADITPHEAADVFKTLAHDHDAIVLLPGSDYLWMAEPFSAVPTAYTAVATDGRSWFGNCIWDAMGVLAVAGVDGHTRNACKLSGVELSVAVAGGRVSAPPDAVVHFVVPARDWWRDIGFT